MPPRGVDYFHFGYTTSTVFVGGAGAVIDLIPGSTNPFPVAPGQVYVVTDFQFHAAQANGAGMPIPLGRNDLAPYGGFRFLVDGVSVNGLFVRVGNAAVETDRFPYLETRPGPQVQSAPFTATFPIFSEQRVEATATFDVLPPVQVPLTLGFEFSGLRMSRTAFEQLMAAI